MSGKAQPMLAGLLTGGLLIAYDALVHYVSTFPDAAGWAAGITLAPALAFVVGGLFKRGGALAALAAGLLATGLAIGLWPLLRQNLSRLYLLQYLGTNLALGLYFARSLGAGRTPLCTAVAAVTQPRLTPGLRRYTRQVTRAWVLFFFASAALSTLLYCLASAHAWSLFSNVLYLPSLAAMFLAEGLLRRHVLPPEERQGVLASIRAYRAGTRKGA